MHLFEIIYMHDHASPVHLLQNRFWTNEFLLENQKTTLQAYLSYITINMKTYYTILILTQF